MTIDINQPYPLLEAQVAQFHRDGFIKLKDVFDARALRYYGNEITWLTIALNTQKTPLAERSTYDRAFLQVMNLWEQGGLAQEFVFGKRLAGIAAALLQVRGVRLYHDQSLYKEPGGGITPAHADQYYWPVDSDRTVTAWVPLQAVPEEMGPLAFFAGSQSVEFGRDLGISDDSEREITANMQAHGFRVVDEPFDLGEVSFHLGWTFHRAGPNRSAQPRSVMTVIYMDRDMKLKAPENHMQQADWEKWCPGAEIGAVIDTPKNPVLFETMG
ncbi:phytanoyl-CoA dioxygenase family protein [Luteimonas sp. SX5]|uniref:Phytanoyl-CoA dioxygenase family protein n=1 Tax=Luteimonas galliterrae TaxID=2940486 RepID=A0ABT0MLG2_9GAMM|nr:phytanoyl-CoA dioxygenase family protein [Luteimonas galliterrae]MCL1635717.1 phytanoyl-CoA dioxygenase family protein [Luteimonas galliterrae]